MTEHEFNEQWEGLLDQIETLPSPARDQMRRFASDTRDRHSRMKKTLADLQESLDYLRLSVKYLVFDLEATRRENGYLRKLIERQADGGFEPPQADEEPPAIG